MIAPIQPAAPPDTTADRIAPVHVVFRYDDCSARSSLGLERRFLQAFADCGAQVTVGVIPRVCERDFHDPGPQSHLPMPDEKIAMLRGFAREGTAEIALHGYYHQVWDGQRHSEYAGLDLEEQCRRLVVGKDELESLFDVPVRTVIPPWNNYDETTLQAMASVGLRNLSACLRGPFEVAGHGVRFLPASCWLRGLSVALPAVLKLRNVRPVLVVMLHDFDFFESRSRDAWLSVDDFADQLRAIAIQPGVRLTTIADACEQGLGLACEELVPDQRWRRFFRRSALPLSRACLRTRCCGPVTTSVALRSRSGGDKRMFHCEEFLATWVTRQSDGFTISAKWAASGVQRERDLAHA